MAVEPRAVALTMLKGGFGKSTIASALTDAFSRREHRALLLDLDPDGHLSTGLGYYEREADKADLRDVLLDDKDPSSIICQTEFGFDLVPSLNLEKANKDLARDEVIRSDQQLASHFVEPLLGNEYDYIVMDLPGTRNKLTNNALVASRNVILPISPVNEALNGIRQTTTKLIGPLREYMDIEVLAVVPNGVRERLDQSTTDRELLESMNTSEQFAAYLEAGRHAPADGSSLNEIDPETVLDRHIPEFARVTANEWEKIDRGEISAPKTPIRHRKAFTRAYRNRTPVSEYDPECDQLQHFDELARIVEEGGIQQ